MSRAILWFEWSRPVEDSNEFVLVEAFTDEGTGQHVNSWDNWSGL